jgi:hypothetical protein
VMLVNNLFKAKAKNLKNVDDRMDIWLFYLFFGTQEKDPYSNLRSTKGQVQKLA